MDEENLPPVGWRESTLSGYWELEKKITYKTMKWIEK